MTLRLSFLATVSLSIMTTTTFAQYSGGAYTQTNAEDGNAIAAFGRNAEFAVLDTRQYRTDQPNGDGLKELNASAKNPDATLLGDEQEHWLQQTLLRSRAEWNVLAQQVMMARVDRVPGEKDLFSMDQWPGYEANRIRVMKFLEERQVPNPVVLTGDIHSNFVNDLLSDYDDPDSKIVGTEFVGTSISSGGDGKQKAVSTDGMMAENPWLKFHNAERGYISCTVTPKEWRSDYQVVEYVTRKGAPLVTRDSWVVENGKPGAVHA